MSHPSWPPPYGQQPGPPPGWPSPYGPPPGSVPLSGPPPRPPGPTPIPRWGVAVVAVTVTLGLVVAVAVLLGQGPSDEEIVAGCQERIGSQALVPPSAIYHPTLWAVTPMPDDTWTVQGTVDAEVRGLPYRGAYACTGLRQVDDGWIAGDVDATFRR